MSNRKLGIVFLTTVITFIAAPQLLYWACPALMENIIFKALISSMLVISPSLIAIFLSRKRMDFRELLPFHKIRIATILKLVLFTALVSPLATFLNVLSQLIVKNAVSGVMNEMSALPFLFTFFLVAVYAPMSEEIVFRGVLYQGFRNNSGAWKAMWYTGILFGIMHMNLNQAAYAFAVGVIMVLLVEATGSLWSSVLYHIIFNGTSVCLLYLLKWLAPELLNTQASEPAESGIIMLISVFVYGVMAVGGCTLAALVYYWIAKGEGRTEYIKRLWTTRKEKKARIMTIPLVIGMVLCVGVMVLRTVRKF